ncbi:MAG: hypothetical protein R3253_06800 [Longimicrobiales bacterium]|nr:hypothetical protein [Longimicrobiales bacterium]
MRGGARGYLTLATGRMDFLEMATDMALSLRQHTDLPIGVVTDEALAPAARARVGPVFDTVDVLEPRFLQGRVRKYGVASASPFREVVFVDADCVVLGSLDHLFQALDSHDVAMLGEQLTRHDDENHHGFSTRWLMERFGLDRYLKTNSGVFAFRRDPAMDVMEAWRRCFLDELRPSLRWSLLRGAWLGDEIAIGVVGGRLGLGTLPPPHVMYWPHEFEGLDLDAPTKPLLHFIWPPPDPVFQRLLEEMAARREEAGVAATVSAPWKAEVGKLKRMRRRRRILERLGWW